MDGKRKREIVQDNNGLLNDSLSVLEQIDESLQMVKLDGKTLDEWWNNFRINIKDSDLNPASATKILVNLQNKLSVAYKRLSKARAHRDSINSLIKDKNTRLRKSLKARDNSLGPHTISQTADLQTADLLPIERIAEIRFRFWDDVTNYLRDVITLISQINFAHNNEIKITQ